LFDHKLGSIPSRPDHKHTTRHGTHCISHVGDDCLSNLVDGYRCSEAGG
jgi:hypothetical protein